MKKMNNKGFSLVELIVVVLIMAIIAVALAPQVMKWVENSRKSTDIENYNALVEAANVASTNEKVIAQVNTSAIRIEMTNAGTTTLTGAMGSSMATTLPGYTNTKITSGDWNGTTFVITVKKNDDGKGIEVLKTNAPQKDFE